MEAYAKRLAEKIDTSEPFVLIGLSFGGMLAVEMLQYITPQKTILISSAANNKEIPFSYKLAGKFRLDNFLPGKKILYNPIFVPYKKLGAESAADRNLVDELHGAADINFTKWAIHSIIHWKRNSIAKNIIRIHGDKDKILPILNFRPDHLIKNGGHFMVVNKANEISVILQNEINNIQLAAKAV